MIPHLVALFITAMLTASEAKVYLVMFGGLFRWLDLR